MLHSPHQEPEKEEGEIYLINPSVKEFKTSYFNENNDPVEVVLAPLESKSFPINEGKIILKHLMNFILNDSGFSYKTDVNIELAKIREKCIVYEQL